MNAFLGYSIVLTSTVIYALLPALLKKSSQTYPPFTVMSISVFVLFLASLILSLIFENGKSLKLIMENKNTLYLLIFVGLINTLSFWLAIQGYKYMPLWQQMLFGLLAPIFTAIFAYFILGEALSLKLFAGLAVMSVGLFIAVR